MTQKDEKIALCPVRDAERPGGFTRWVDELRDELTAVAPGGELRVYSTLCPHAAGELRCRGERFVCLWHGARFDVSSGRAPAPSSLPPLRRYAATARDGQVLLT